MCGRFAFTSPVEAVADFFKADASRVGPVAPNTNVCPTQNIVTLVSFESDRILTPMRWGFIPHWYQKPNDGPLLINARAETLADKPAFKSAARERRCLIPVSGFYEWTKDASGARLPWYFTRADGAPGVFAGVWQSWGADEPVNTCAIVTTSANEATSTIHHRMPVVLEPDEVSLWLGEQGKGAATLMRAAPEDALRWHRVDRAVNSNRAAGAQLIEAVLDEHRKG